MKVGMMRGGVLLVLGVFSGGCYRTTTLDHEDLKRIEPVGDRRMRVEYQDGKREEYEYDRLKVFGFEHHTKLELERPVTADISRGAWHVADAKSKHQVPMADVDVVELEQYAPSRPWVILASTLGAGVLGAVIGVSAGECGGEFRCMQKGYYGAAGFLGGTVVGLAVSIPISGHLYSSEPATEAKQSNIRSRSAVSDGRSSQSEVGDL